ncbi:MAG TPA: PIG-L family deacetylase [Tepidisphaeraceae bacterium]|jgi:LmbE family N-acetylglucosaminyl deacetylase|nr:PIG-L family deacetylase [Tepidisphaeraceae bacterium]
MTQSPVPAASQAPRRSVGRAISRRLQRALAPLLRPLRDWQAPRIHRWMMHVSSKPTELPTKSALIIAPHHDDETFGCGGLIALKRDAGIPVKIVIVTDGRQSHGSVPGTDVDALTQTRKREALQAINILGVATEDVHFLDLPDQGLLKLDESRRKQAVAQLADLLRAFRPEELYVNHRTDRHPDHEATFRLTESAIAEAAVPLRVYQYPIWLIWKGPCRASLRPKDLAGALRLDVRAAQERKDRAIALYASQLPVLPPGFVGQFQQGYEVFFPADRAN